MLLRDLRLAMRTLRNHPGMSVTAIVSVALGIGPNVAIFSVVNALVLRPLPLEDPHELVRVHPGSESVSYPDYLYYRDRNAVFSGLMAESGVSLTSRHSSELERLAGAIVTGNYFEVLGVDAALGRTFEPADDEVPGAHPVAVVSHSYYQRRLAGGGSALGATLWLNNHPFMVVGVAPPEFTGTFLGPEPEVWVPMAMQAVAWPGKDRLHNRRLTGLTMSARLTPGVTVVQARAAVETLRAQLKAADPGFRMGWERVVVERAGTLHIGARIPVLVVTGLLTAVVALVLGVACANLGNLLLARGFSRRREIALRQALGADRRHLVRQLLAESLVLGASGGLLGLFLALSLFPPLLARATSALPIHLDLDLSPDPRVLAFTLGLSLLSALVFGLAPALRTARGDLVTSLRGDGFTGPARHLGGPRNVLVAVQVALALVALTGGGLFLRSLQQVTEVDPGFDLSRNLLAPIDTGGAGLGRSEGQTYYSELLKQAERMPRVEAAALSAIVPLSMNNMSRNVLADGENHGSAYYNVISAGYFDALAIPLLSGRDFSDSDVAGAPGVAIVNETLARRLWPSAGAHGRDLRQLTFEGPSVPYRVVGVVADSKYLTLGEEPQPVLYLPLAQHYEPRMHLHLRTAVGPAVAARQILARLREVDGDVAVELSVAQAQVLGTTARLLPELGATLLGTFALLGLAVAAVGIYGLAAFALGRRHHEIGVRLALGGERGQVLRHLLWDCLRPSLAGVAAGVLLAMVVMRAVDPLLYGVNARDPRVFGCVATLLVAVSLVATFVPARKAMAVDPGTLLKVE